MTRDAERKERAKRGDDGAKNTTETKPPLLIQVESTTIVIQELVYDKSHLDVALEETVRETFHNFSARIFDNRIQEAPPRNSIDNDSVEECHPRP